MREGDIEAIRNKLRDEGRPMKSRIIMDKDVQTFFKTDKRKVHITEKVKLGRN